MTLDPARPFLISPPFGAHLGHARAYSVLGSYTVNPRPGRLGQVLRTLRPVPGGWVNAVGLRNPGIAALLEPPVLTQDRAGSRRSQRPWKYPGAHGVYSLAPLHPRDWEGLIHLIDSRYAPHKLNIEFNVSCPNVGESAGLPPRALLERLTRARPNGDWDSGLNLIFKLPPLEASYAMIDHLLAGGVRYFHLSNTLPSPVGGVSGAALREVNLPLVERCARAYPAAEIIAGGGIYTPADLLAYRDAGARRFSLGTAWFWPPRAHRIIRSLA